MPNAHTGLRASEELMERVDTVTKKLQGDDELQALTKVTRASVTRLALVVGIKQLEKNNLREVPPKLDSNSKHYGFSSPQWLLERAESVARQGSSWTRAGVMRAAISEGLEILNERYKTELSNEQT
jgi:hypothetical protein